MGSINSPKIQEPSQISKRQKGDMKQVPYWGPTDIKHQCVQNMVARATWCPVFMQPRYDYYCKYNIFYKHFFCVAIPKVWYCIHVLQLQVALICIEVKINHNPFSDSITSFWVPSCNVAANRIERKVGLVRCGAIWNPVHSSYQWCLVSSIVGRMISIMFYKVRSANY